MEILPLLVARSLAALFSNISDCDEIFNYWEPLHFMQYGYGLQTWEYSPEFSIRSWFYILVHSLPSMLIRLYITYDKVYIFYATRLLLALSCAASEIYFYRQISKYINPMVAKYYLIISTFNVGMFISSAAFLPSSFAMIFVTLGTAKSLSPSSNLSVFLTIFCFVVGSVIGWPFSAALLAPITTHSCLHRNFIKNAAKWISFGILNILLVVIPTIYVDFYFYKKLVFVPWNIVAYNIFSEDKGPNIYGTEPWWFYFANLALNFNIAFVLALFGSLLTSVFDLQVLGPSRKIWILSRMSLMWMWLGIFSFQQHKEERFMFAVYPVICMNASICLYLSESALLKWTMVLKPLKKYRQHISKALMILLFTFYCLLSVSRIFALYLNYHAPLDIYESLRIPGSNNINTTLALDDTEISLCVGKEWYRFPGHYFLPKGVRLRFLKSDFNGQLPKYFIESTNDENTPELSQWFNRKDGSWMMPTSMNDLNLEETDRYVNVDTCNLLIDVDYAERSEASKNEPRYIKHKEDWEIILCTKFLDANSSSGLGRILYIPFVSDRYSSWGEYCLLKKISIKV